MDFECPFILNDAGALFVRAKGNMKMRRQYSSGINKDNGLRRAQTIVLTGANTKDADSNLLRHVMYHITKTDKTFTLSHQQCRQSGKDGCR